MTRIEIQRAVGFVGVLQLLLLFAPTVRADRIACTEQALHAKIAALNANCTGDKTITFDCNDTTIYINDVQNWIKTCGGLAVEATCDSDADCVEESCLLNQHGCNRSGDGCTDPGQPYQCCTGSGTGTCCSGDPTKRDIHCDGVVIDGEDRNVTFKLDPPCDARVGPDQCTELERQSNLFRVEADDVTIRNITMSHFWSGIYSSADNTVVEDNVLIRGCDNTFVTLKSHGLSKNVVFQRNIVTLGCDKCLTLQGHDLPDDALPYPQFTSKILNNTFASCRVSIKVENGRHLIQGNRFDLDPSMPWSYHYAVYAGRPGRSDDPAVYFKDNEVRDSWYGVAVRGNAEFVSLGGNTFSSNKYSGLHVGEFAKAMIQHDTFTGNGGLNDPRGYEGGVTLLSDSGKLDLGSGSLTLDGQALSSLGNNQFIGNRGYSDAVFDLDVWNQGSSVTIPAQGNWWNTSTASVIQGNVTGSVGFSPFLEAPPTQDTDGTLLPPESLWRTDLD